MYDDAGGTVAARLWWMLRYFGHERAAVLDEPQPSAPAVLLYARPYAAFQAASGQKYTADEDGRIEVIDPDDARDLKRCGCRVAHG